MTTDYSQLSRNILSDIIVNMKYSKYLPEKRRRETWDEIVTRNKNMHIEKYPQLKDDIEEAYTYVYSKKILPSMRALQFAGKPIELNPARGYNCSYAPVDDWRVFSEAMFLLLGGTGFGYSVQRHHVEMLPEIRKPVKTTRYLVGDSIEGWADSIKVLMKAYFSGGALPRFDFRDIRSKGTRLVTSGGKAPGPDPLKECLFKVQMVLDRKENGDRLSTLECHDIMCYIADAVLAGGIRRAAMIAFFDFDDEDMLTCKYGNWYEQNPQRSRANNSVVILRHKIDRDDFLKLWKKIEASRSGEPGVCFTNDKEMLFNPCSEASLKAFSFCNLTEINTYGLESQEDLDARAKAVTLIGTLQASYTDFHYLRDCWKKATEKDALLGVSLAGIASGDLKQYDLKQTSKVVLEENARVADIIGIKKATRIGLVKPSGTASLVLGTSSGIHAWYAPYYLRRVRVLKTEAIYKYLSIYHPELIEDDVLTPHRDACITVPIKAPEDAIVRTESPIDLLERVKYINENWIRPTHRKGSNTHNVSATVYIKDDEWELIGDWMWENRKHYNGLSVLPYDGGTYVQAPHEEITKEQYDELVKHLTVVDVSNIIEEEDETNFTGEVACSGGACELR